MKTSKKVNTEPRISLNKLGEFLTTSPSRRRRILMDQKYPSTFIVARYNDAENAISDFISNGLQDFSVLDVALKELDEKTVNTEWEAQTKSLNYEALDSFYDFADQIEFHDSEFVRVNKREVSSMVFDEVAISVRPEILIYRDNKNDKQIGAVKLFFSKNNSLTKQSGEYIASLLMRYLKEFGEECVPSHKICCVVDVFAQQIYFAPASYKRRMADVMAACQEISAIWSKL